MTTCLLAFLQPFSQLPSRQKPLPWCWLPSALLRYSRWSQQGSYSKVTKPAWLLSQAGGGMPDQVAQAWPSDTQHACNCSPTHTDRSGIRSNAACKRCPIDRGGDWNQVSATQHPKKPNHRAPIKESKCCHSRSEQKAVWSDIIFQQGMRFHLWQNILDARLRGNSQARDDIHTVHIQWQGSP